MAGQYNIKSGKSYTMDVKCQMADSCLVNRAFALHTRYVSAVLENEKLHKKHDQRLQMAEFVREVAFAAAKSKEIADEVWKNLRASESGGAAKDYGTTWLKKEIEEIKQALQQSMKKIETRAETLTKFIGSEVFQKHLVRYHTKTLDSAAVKAYYPDVPSADMKNYRELDVYLALLTVELAQSNAGRAFLEKITDEQWLTKAVGFSDMWSYIGKVKGTAEAAGQLVHNFGPVLTAKINLLINQGKVGTIDDILRDPDLKRHFDFLDKKYKISISTWLKKKAAIYGQGAQSTAKKMRYRSGMQKSFQNWLNKSHEDFDPSFKKKIDVSEHGAKLNGMWLNMTLDSVSLAMSVVKLFSDLKKAKPSDWIGILNDLLGFSKTVFEMVESRIIVVNGHQTNSAAYFKGAARWAGLFAGVITAILSIMQAYKGFKSKDWDIVLIGIAGAGLGVAGGIAAFCGLTTMGGITVILGILLAVASALILDPPIIDYLEDVEWGEDRVIKVADTIIEYYKKMFSLSVKFIVAEYDVNFSFIRIESNILGNTVPVYVELLTSSKKSLGKQTIYPGMKKVAGKGMVEKEPGGWDYAWPFHGKRLKISNPWDIWTGIKRDDKTEYIIRAGIDPSNNAKMAIGKMALNDETSGVEFPEKQTPMLIQYLPTGYMYSTPGMRVVLVGGSWKRYISNKHGSICFYVYTKYASGCTIKIITEKDNLIFDDPLTTVSVPVSSNTPDKNGIVKTPVTVSLPIPSQSSGYRINIETKLLGPDGKKCGSSSTYHDITS